MLRLRPVGLMILLAALSACSSDSAEPEPSAERAAAPAAPAEGAEESRGDALTIVYLGDSLTAGYGLAEGEDEAYPALVEQKAEALGWNVRTVNAGISGDTSAGGLRRVDWIVNRGPVDVLVLALGANDGLRGLPVEALKENLVAIIARVRAVSPGVRIVLAGMMTPTNMGSAYGERFAEVYREVAEEQHVELIPFLLDGVGGVRSLNQPDGVHPTAEGQRVMAETVWQTLRPVLEEARADRG